MSLLEIKNGTTTIVSSDSNKTTIKLNTSGTYTNKDISIKASIPAYDGSVQDG